MKRIGRNLALLAAAPAWAVTSLVLSAPAVGQLVEISIATPMEPPEWARLQRELLAVQGPACQEFYEKYFDERGYLQCFVRWGANDGPDDAFENFNGWPELHALGGDDTVRELYTRGNNGLIRQYSEAKTVEVPAGRDGMYYKEFSAQSDWMHHGEGMQLHNRMGLSSPRDPQLIERARRFAGLYMNEDPEAPNYDPEHKIIRSMINGSKGPLLRPATAIDWVGDPFDVSSFVTVHRERSFEEFLAHYEEYTDVVGDNCLNLAATELAAVAFMLTGDDKYKDWIIEYVDAWAERIKQNGGIIPSYVDLEGRIGGPEGRWWGMAYGWGFSPVDPVNGRRANRHRIPRALVGFNNALLVTGDQRYVDAWRPMFDAVNAHARTVDGRTQYPTMRGDEGWYGWTARPWSIGALEVWYWSQRDDDLRRALDAVGGGRGRGGRRGRGRFGGGAGGWLDFLQGANPGYPEAALRADLATVARRVEGYRRDDLPPEQRLADNMLNYNPATIGALVRLMLGGLPPGQDGGLLNARLRYFDPTRQRAGVPEDVAALVESMTADETVLTLVNLHESEPRTVIVQGGAYGEHQFKGMTIREESTPFDAPLLAVRLAPGAGARLTLDMDRYANTPTMLHPWHRN